MRFSALHVSFSKIEDGWVFALADSSDGTGPIHVLISFGEESEQDRALNLTGLYLAPSWSKTGGYGFVERLAFDGETLTIFGHLAQPDIVVDIATQMLSQDEILDVVERCNRANATKPERAA